MVPLSLSDIQMGQYLSIVMSCPIQGYSALYPVWVWNIKGSVTVLTCTWENVWHTSYTIHVAGWLWKHVLSAVWQGVLWESSIPHLFPKVEFPGISTRKWRSGDPPTTPSSACEHRIWKLFQCLGLEMMLLLLTWGAPPASCHSMHWSCCHWNQPLSTFCHTFNPCSCFITHFTWPYSQWPCHHLLTSALLMVGHWGEIMPLMACEEVTVGPNMSLPLSCLRLYRVGLHPNQDPRFHT